jgi:hypothetical protein
MAKPARGGSAFSTSPAVAWSVAGAVLGLVLLLQSPLAGQPAASRADRPPALEPAAPLAEAEDRDRKARLLGSDRWRRAMFELDEWLETQPVYTPAQVRRIKADLAQRVAGMSSYEIDYLLDSLDAKLRILDSPRARDAREWLGRYLAVMADWKRAELLKDVPNVVDMTAGELATELQAVEEKRRAVEKMAGESERSRRDFAAFTETNRRRDAAIREARSWIRKGDVTFSPYRGQPVADPPFTGAYDSPTVVGVGTWLTSVGITAGSF